MMPTSRMRNQPGDAAEVGEQDDKREQDQDADDAGAQHSGLSVTRGIA